MTDNNELDLIGLVGLAGAGKDTVGKRLFFEYDFVPIAFADALKQDAYAMDPYIESVHARLGQVVRQDGWDAAKQIPGVRKLLQDLGAALRAIDPLHWVTIVEDNIYEDRLDRAMFKRHDDVTFRKGLVVTDVRYQNEADMIRRKGGVLIRVERDVEVMDHISETGQADIEVDYTISNNGTIPELHEAIDNLMQTLNIPKQEGI